jgi:putative hemolysin
MEYFIILILILLNGFFAMCEIALVSSKKSKIESLFKAGEGRASSALKLLGEPEKFLSAIQVAMTLIGVFAGAYGGITIAEKLTPYVEQFASLREFAYEISLAVVVSSITFLSIIIGELVPKTFALTNPEKIAISISPIISVFSKVTYPIVVFLTFTTKIFLRILFVKETKEQDISEEELKLLIKLANKQGVIEKKESEFIHNIFRFADRKAYSIMTHRNNVIWLDIEDDLEEIATAVLSNNYSKFPVYRESLENIVGVLNSKDFLANYKSDVFKLTEILHQPVFIPENLPAIKILELFRNERSYYGIVVNEYGSTEGVLTLHDLTENIFGSLPDQEAEDAPSIVVREDGSYLVDGSMLIDEIMEYIQVKDFMSKDRTYHSLAGYILFKLRKIPSVGNHFTEGNFKFEIMDMDRSKIDKILITKINEDEAVI